MSFGETEGVGVGVDLPEGEAGIETARRHHRSRPLRKLMRCYGCATLHWSPRTSQQNASRVHARHHARLVDRAAKPPYQREPFLYWPEFGDVTYRVPDILDSYSGARGTTYRGTLAVEPG